MAAPWNPLMYDERYVRRRAVPNSHTSSVVFCHDSGERGGDWLPIVDQLRSLARLDHVAFVFPYMTYGGEESSAAAVSLIQTIVAEEIEKGIAAGRMAVAAVGQGALIALQAVLTGPTKIAGVAGLATPQVDGSAIVSKRAAAQAQTPVMVASRPAGSTPTGKDLAEQLQAAGQPVEALVHNEASFGAKSGLLTQQVLEDLAAFLGKVLPVEK